MEAEEPIRKAELYIKVLPSVIDRLKKFKTKNITKNSNFPKVHHFLNRLIKRMDNTDDLL
ncbi:MAG: hypothetical protein BGO52_06495 [Sphingobacteriales bacterium 44-61]|nr:MAG: hypothetical protein BGO52_06495 [Sphingobacteriales bacterium 44-61]